MLESRSQTFFVVHKSLNTSGFHFLGNDDKRNVFSFLYNKWYTTSGFHFQGNDDKKIIFSFLYNKWLTTLVVCSILLMLLSLMLYYRYIKMNMNSSKILVASKCQDVNRF